MIGRDLMGYYKTNLTLHENHDWDLTYFDNLYPFERDLYLGLLIIQMKEKRQKDEELQRRL